MSTAMNEMEQWILTYCEIKDEVSSPLLTPLNKGGFLHITLLRLKANRKTDWYQAVTIPATSIPQQLNNQIRVQEHILNSRIK